MAQITVTPPDCFIKIEPVSISELRSLKHLVKEFSFSDFKEHNLKGCLDGHGRHFEIKDFRMVGCSDVWNVVNEPTLCKGTVVYEDDSRREDERTYSPMIVFRATKDGNEAKDFYLYFSEFCVNRHCSLEEGEWMDPYSSTKQIDMEDYHRRMERKLIWEERPFSKYGLIRNGSRIKNTYTENIIRHQKDSHGKIHSWVTCFTFVDIV